MALRVAHLVASFDTGGLQNGIVNLINHGRAGAIEHVVLSLSPKVGMADRLSRGEVRSVDVAGLGARAALGRIAAVLREIAPDVLHTRNRATHVEGVLAGVLAGVPGRVHGYHGRDLDNAAGERLRIRVLGRVANRFVRRVVVLTEAMKREFRRDYGIADEKIVVIPNGIDLERMAHFEADPSLRSSFTVAAVGRLDPVKNLALLIRAFQAMPGRSPGDRLVLAGEGPERPRLENLIRELGLGDSVRMLGERRDVPAVMKAADVLVQASHYEGMSNTLVEAMACGTAVVATDVGGNADVTGREGAALLVPSDEVAFLAEALGVLRCEPETRARIAAAGRTRVLERFGLERMVSAYEALYEDVRRLSGPGRGRS